MMTLSARLEGGLEVGASPTALSAFTLIARQCSFHPNPSSVPRWWGLIWGSEGEGQIAHMFRMARLP
jgi:hypothetical protein